MVLWSKNLSNQYLPPVIQIPSSLLLTAITQSCPAVITVSIGNTSTEANTYIVGMAIRLFIPQSYRMYQANNKIVTITNIDGSDFTINLDTSQYDAFVIPASTAETPASISPNGSRNLQYNNNTDLVPFQSLNNIGN